MTSLERVRARRFPVAKAAEFVGVGKQTIYRWNRIGINGHKLTMFKVGCRTYVSESDLERFMELTSVMPAAANESATMIRSAGELDRAVAAATARCEAMGF